MQYSWRWCIWPLRIVSYIVTSCNFFFHSPNPITLYRPSSSVRWPSVPEFVRVYTIIIHVPRGTWPIFLSPAYAGIVRYIIIYIRIHWLIGRINLFAVSPCPNRRYCLFLYRIYLEGITIIYNTYNITYKCWCYRENCQRNDGATV